jgi:hypothetical protein
MLPTTTSGGYMPRHRAATAAALLVAGLALTGCSSSNHGHAKVTFSGKYRPLNSVTTTPATEPPIPSDSKLATGARTAACWKAVRNQYTPGTVHLTGAPTTPPECAGLSSDEISDVVSDVLAHQLGG